jgi:hypothetical protein
VANRIKTFEDGDLIEAADTNAEFNNIYIGDISRTAGYWGSEDDIPTHFGDDQDATIEFNTDQTNDMLMIGLDGTSNTMIICQKADLGTDLAKAVATNPTLHIHSSDKTVATDFIDFYHDATDGWVNVGANALRFGVAGTQEAAVAAGGFVLQDDKTLSLGAAGDAAIEWNTDQTQDTLMIGLGASRTLVVCEKADMGTDITYGAQSHPTIHIHSSDVTTAANYIALTHNDTDGVITSGAGDIKLVPATLTTLSIEASATVRLVDMIAGDMGAGDTNKGPILRIGNNSNGEPAPGCLALRAKDGSDWFIWAEADGTLRTHSDPPGNADDGTLGTLISAQV